MAKPETTNITPTAVAVAVAVVVALGFLFFGSGIFTPFAPEESAADTELAPTSEPTSTNDAGTSMITDVVIGTGAEAVPGKTVSVQYTGTLEDGTVFDSSIPRGAPITFVLGTGRVIAGWEQGIAGMKVGGKRHLVIPPELGYGPNANGPIPANSTLIFDVELVNVQ